MIEVRIRSESFLWLFFLCLEGNFGGRELSPCWLVESEKHVVRGDDIGLVHSRC